MSSIYDCIESKVGKWDIIEGGMLFKADDPEDCRNYYIKNLFPELTITRDGENYYPQCNFSWSRIKTKEKYKETTVIYERNNYCAIKALMNNSEEIWIDGRFAPYEGCFKGHYLGGDENVVCVSTYKITEIDNDTNKVVFEQSIDSFPNIVHDVKKYAKEHFRDADCFDDHKGDIEECSEDYLTPIDSIDDLPF